MNALNFLRCAAIISSLPVTLTNGTTADATQVMADLNWIVNQVNANAAPLSNTALLNANNNFTVVQSGVAATGVANFPIASQVQNWSFNNLTSTLGTNSMTARVISFPLSSYTVGQVFTFVPAQTNTASATINIDGLGSAVIRARGAQLIGGELQLGVSAAVRIASTGSQPVADIIGPSVGASVLVGTATASNSATLDFIGLTGYSSLTIVFDRVLPATDGADFWVRGSTNGGATYDSGANYAYQYIIGSNTGVAAAGSASANQGLIAPSVDNLIEGVTGTLNFKIGGSTTTFTGVIWARNSSASFPQIFSSGGTYNGAVTTALRFMFSAGNITSGTITIYGNR